MSILRHNIVENNQPLIDQIASARCAYNAIPVAKRTQKDWPRYVATVTALRARKEMT